MNNDRLAISIFCRWLAIVSIGFASLAGLQACKKEASRTIGIHAVDGYEDATRSAMDVWNSFVGCDFLVPGDRVKVMAANGEPCGKKRWLIGEEIVAADAWQCENSNKSEIHMRMPGHTNTQACIIAHEIGHILRNMSVRHHSIGVMSSCEFDSVDRQNVLRIRDADANRVGAYYCE